MLKQRLITAAILIPLVVWALLALPTSIVQWLLALIALLAGWEWLQLIGVVQTSRKIAILSLLVILGAVSFLYLPDILLVVAVSVWLLATMLIMLFANRPLPIWLASLFRQPAFGVVTAALILIGFVGSASLVHASLNNGPGLLLFVLVTVWLADTGGYFSGKQFGKHALAREISPNKTWEGVVGGIVLSSAWAVLFYVTAGNLTLSLAAWLLITVFIVMISIVGDLFESVFKRCFKVKDSGQLLPGHGGMLDRIDSLLAAVPVFAAVMTVMGAL